MNTGDCTSRVESRVPHACLVMPLCEQLRCVVMSSGSTKTIAHIPHTLRTAIFPQAYVMHTDRAPTKTMLRRSHNRKSHNLLFMNQKTHGPDHLCILLHRTSIACVIYRTNMNVNMHTRQHAAMVVGQPSIVMAGRQSCRTPTVIWRRKQSANANNMRVRRHADPTRFRPSSGPIDRLKRRCV